MQGILGQSPGRGRSSNKGGHMKWDCPDLKNKNKDDKNEGSSRSTNVVEEDSDVDDGDLLSVASTFEHPVDYWLLDSACSFSCDVKQRLI